MSESIEQLKTNSREAIPAKPEKLGLNDEKGIETHEDLAQLAEKRIVDASSIAVSLESDGKNRLEEIENSVKISGGKLNDSEVKLGMEEVSKKAKSLLETFKAQSKKITAIVMATMAFSGAGDFEKVKGKGGSGDKTGAESIENLKQSAKTEEERKAIENYEKALRESQESIQKTDETVRMGEIKRKGDPELDTEKVRNNLMKHVGSRL